MEQQQVWLIAGATAISVAIAVGYIWYNASRDSSDMEDLLYDYLLVSEIPMEPVFMANDPEECIRATYENYAKVGESYAKQVEDVSRLL